MSRVLLAWELGSGIGHLGRLAPLAQALRWRGHAVTLVLKDLSGLGHIAALDTFDALQAPVWLKPDAAADAPQSYADILARFGYADAADLRGMVNAWRGLYRLVNPDLIVADHAPTALLAAHATAIPRATYGAGFFLPPRAHPLPNMRPWLDIPAEELAARERAVLATVNAVLSGLRVPPLAVLADLLAADAHFLMTFRELDHYGNRSGGEYLGVISAEGEIAVPAWPHGGGKRVFAYLRGNYSDMAKLVSALKNLDASAVIFAPGIDPAAAEKLQSARIVFSTRPFAISEVAQQCDLAICHGGLATVAACLRAACPLFLLPTQLEQYLTGVNVERMGAGLLTHPDVPEPDFLAPLARLLRDSSFKARAMDFADRHAGYDPANVLEGIVSRCEQIIAMRPREHGQPGRGGE